MLTTGFGSIDIAQLVTRSLEMLKTLACARSAELASIASSSCTSTATRRSWHPTTRSTVDPFVVRNIFPAEAAARAAELGMDLDDSQWPPTASVDPCIAVPTPTD